MTDAFNTKVFTGKGGRLVRLARNIAEHSRDTESDPIFIKTKSPDDRNSYSTLTLEQARDFRDHLSTLIEEVEAMQPKEPTKADFARALPEGTLFSNRSVEFIRLDGDKIYNKSFGEVRNIDDYFGSGVNNTLAPTALKIGPVTR